VPCRAVPCRAVPCRVVSYQAGARLPICFPLSLSLSLSLSLIHIPSVSPHPISSPARRCRCIHTQPYAHAAVFFFYPILADVEANKPKYKKNTIYLSFWCALVSDTRAPQTSACECGCPRGSGGLRRRKKKKKSVEWAEVCRAALAPSTHALFRRGSSQLLCMLTPCSSPFFFYFLFTLMMAHTRLSWSRCTPPPSRQR